MAEKVTLNFRERHKPVIVLEFPNRKIELNPNLDIEDMGEACVWEEARDRGERLLMLMDLKNPESIREAKEVVADALNLARDYIGYLVERTKPGQKMPTLTGPEVDKIMDALSPREAAPDPFSQEVIGSIAEWLTAGASSLDATSEGPDGGDGEPGEEGGKTAPLAQKKRSRSRSSSSRSRSKTAASAGGRTGGEESPGESSKPTSRTSRQPAPVPT